MIVRKSNINPKAREVRLTMAFGSPDAKAWLKDILQVFGGGMTEHEGQRLPFDEVSMRQTLERSKFNVIEPKWAQQLSAWSWAQWIALGFMTASSTREGVYFLTERGLSLVKWAKPHSNDQDPI